jgi:chorismate mutase
MAEKRHLELHLLRLLPSPLKDDFVTVGLVLLESDGGFADLRVTRDWRMLQCVAPNVELEWFGIVENEIRGSLGQLQRRDELLQLVNERFGSILDVAPTKAVATYDPVKEMEVLASIYLAPVERGERVQQRAGRGAMISLMNDAFANASVLELMQKDLDMTGYLGSEDPFQIDFGYRVGNAIKMLHAISLRANADQAQLFAYRYSRIDEGMRREQLQPSLTAVVDRTIEMRDERARIAIGMMEQNSVRVRVVGEIGEIADEVRRELRV